MALVVVYNIFFGYKYTSSVIVQNFVYTAEAGYDEVDKQVGNANDDSMDTGENNDNNNKPSEDDNTEANMEEGKEKDNDDEKEQENKKPTKSEDYFTMSIVNGYGSQVLRNLVDDDAPLKLNSKSVCVCVCVACIKSILYLVKKNAKHKGPWKPIASLNLQWKLLITIGKILA